MSSHDSTVDGGMGLGAPGGGAQVAIGEVPSGAMSVQAGSAGGLTLDEAESIAARRLRELAIRLSDDEEGEISRKDEPGLTPFDADRHMRRRLARRMASLDGDEEPDDAGAAKPRVWPLAQVGQSPGYAVSEALPLAAFGDGLVALSSGRLGLPALPPPPEDDVPADRSAAAPVAQHAADDAVALAPDAADDAREPEMRLIDLINQQRALLDTLGQFNDAAPAVFDTTEAGLASAPAEIARSDAEELFEVGTYAPEFAGLDETAETEERSASLSAEQLIAALNKVGAERKPEGEAHAPFEPAAAANRLPSTLLRELVDHEPTTGSLQLMLHRSSPLPSIAGDVAPKPASLSLELPASSAFSSHALPGDPASERPPIIIARARAEMTALASGTGLQPVAGPSPVIGFFAGLSFSLVCGVALYFLL